MTIPQGPPGNVFQTHDAPMFHDPNAPHGSLGASAIEWGRPSPYGYQPSHYARRGMQPRAMGQIDPSTGAIVYGALSTASMAASAYHGYKRNQSIGWALWWGFAGAVFPVVTPVIAVAQGFGERKRGR